MPPCLLIQAFWLWQAATAPQRRVRWRRWAGCVLWPRPDGLSAFRPAGPAASTNRLWRAQVQAFLAEVVQAPAVWWGHSLGSLVASAAPCSWSRLGAGRCGGPPLPDPTLAGRVPRSRAPLAGDGCSAVGDPALPAVALELLVPLIARTPLLRSRIQSAYSHCRIATANCVS